MAERDVTVLRGREGETAAVVGVLSARGVGKGAFVGVRPPSGGHMLHRASVDSTPTTPEQKSQFGNSIHYM